MKSSNQAVFSTAVGDAGALGGGVAQAPQEAA